MPFNVTNSIEFSQPDPKTNADPLFVPAEPSEKTKTVMMINARAYLPVVIYSSGNNVTYLEPNSNYTMDGNERLVNSGWLWPEGQTPPGGPPISNFTITFEKPGHLFLFMQFASLDEWQCRSQLIFPIVKDSLYLCIRP